MQQLSAYSSASHVPNTMKAMERAARDASVASGSFDLFGGDGFDVSDVLDVINPLQQIPGVSSLYRAATGDGIATIARLAGGALLGGPLGFVIAAINAGIESATGDDVGGHLMAMFSVDTPSPTSVAALYQNATKLG